MKTIKLLISSVPSFVLLLMCSLVFGQDSTSKLVHKKFYYPDGSLSSEGTLKDGKPEGYWKNYYPWGILKSEGNRAQFELSGTWKFYDEVGNLQRSISYKEGKKYGPIKTYSDSCYLIREEPFIADVKHGIEKEYFNRPGELLKKEIPYKEGVRDGTSIEYDEEGRIITLIIYRHGFVKSKENINRSNALGKQGTWKWFYPNGQLEWEKRYKNDVLHGYAKHYDANGRLIEATLYLDGVAQQDEELIARLEMKRTYHENGQLAWEGGYNYEGKAEGVHIYYDDKGKISEVKVFDKDVLLAKGELNEDGQRIGYWEEYYADGSVKSKGKYKDGIKIGEWSHFFANGTLEQKGKYTKDGKPSGLWVWYYENGNVLREENFRKGLEDGSFIEYSRSGEVITKGDYLDGKKEGFWYYETGDYREEGNYRDDRREGVWKYYYNNGTLLFQGEYIDGYPEGKHRYYYADGVLKREENYSVGEPDGVWKSYTASGDLFLTAVYRNGKEYKLDNRKLKD